MIKQALAWLRRAGRLEMALLLVVTLVIGGIWGFVLLVDRVLENGTGRFDDRLLLALREPGNPAVPIGPHWGLQVERDLTALGSGDILLLVVLAVCGYLALQRRLALMAFVVVSIVSGSVLGFLLKAFVNRPRPHVVPYLSDFSTASFPSGHSMLSSIVYLTLGALLARGVPDTKTKVYFVVLPVCLTALVGCSRVYLGVHYPTDVLAGWCAGSTWAIICCAVATFVERRRLLATGEREL